MTKPKVKEPHSMEYEDAPSGSIIFYNYKEPLMKFEGGFGFDGALIADEKTGQIQCHFCGYWGETLQHHLKKEHNMTVGEYKDKVSLNTTTALISEKFRANLIARGLEKRMKNFKKNPYKHTEATKARIRATRMEGRMEAKNGTNTCPEQLIERLIALYNELGRTPKIHTEIMFKEALLRTYGSFKEACRIAGIPYRNPGQTVTPHTKYTEENTVDFIYKFYLGHNRLPKGKEIETGRYNAIKSRLGGMEAIKRKVLTLHGEYKPISPRFRYSNEELIRFLQTFEKIHGRKPSYSDCRRKLLPNLSKYTYRFGSWKNALAFAFPETPQVTEILEVTELV